MGSLRIKPMAFALLETYTVLSYNNKLIANTIHIIFNKISAPCGKLHFFCFM